MSEKNYCLNYSTATDERKKPKVYAKKNKYIGEMEKLHHLLGEFVLWATFLWAYCIPEPHIDSDTETVFYLQAKSQGPLGWQKLSEHLIQPLPHNFTHLEQFKRCLLTSPPLLSLSFRIAMCWLCQASTLPVCTGWRSRPSQQRGKVPQPTEPSRRLDSKAPWSTVRKERNEGWLRLIKDKTDKTDPLHSSNLTG